MKKKMRDGFAEHRDELLRTDPAFAKEYFRQLAELPLPTQLAILRGHRNLTQSDVAKKLRVKQPQVARVERVSHDPRLSSIVAQARAVGCRVMLVPNEVVDRMPVMVCDKSDYPVMKSGKSRRIVRKRGWGVE